MPMREMSAALRWVQRYESVRQSSVLLAAPLSAEDACVQSMPDASPAKWHLAHTTWFFETFVLARHAPHDPDFDPDFRVLFNSYYQQVGARHPRAQRGLLTRPLLARVLAYRDAVDRRMLCMLESWGAQPPARLTALLELGLQHEQQHQELLLTDIKHLLSCHPLWPAYRASDGDDESGPAPQQDMPPAIEWRMVPRGMHAVGHAGRGFAFDNELPRHEVFLPGCEIASRPVANAEFLRFVEEGGYAQPQWWLAEGWDWRCAQQLEHPWYWRRDGVGGWQEFSLHGALALDGRRPVAHVSYFEADAYARWAGARLPTEAEWETAFAQPMAQRPAGEGPPGPVHPRAMQAGCASLGEVWEWTQSSYAPYPGFRVAEGAVGEYNGKFMVNQYVLRGGSCLTPPGHARASYRNFFPTQARWQMTGLRLARDCG
ncbi:Iron(II)-dependent oxidoreductase EgtB [Delftia tsuruhatensis]|uniref:ergothioneine biosynthesis protein EgtB n=1 Tax=Delftia tsuruhatensis TaxID=180282 RepID=UPI001E7F6C70|nr:ergothioneine biosynthesis protein EgtB [Delftia tsuruhatensis]CAB5707932.1 Iron(II)-dependent oxidoreductase EgtB [Delftia tsuruhatensis]CAC9680543.1 Iron(II)-dependent oxidoreductase EgtB [Delftia tsuruhatensis]